MEDSVAISRPGRRDTEQPTQQARAGDRHRDDGGAVQAGGSRCQYVISSVSDYRLIVIPGVWLRRRQWRMPRHAPTRSREPFPRWERLTAARS